MTRCLSHICPYFNSNFLLLLASCPHWRAHQFWACWRARVCVCCQGLEGPGGVLTQLSDRNFSIAGWPRPTAPCKKQSAPTTTLGTALELDLTTVLSQVRNCCGTFLFFSFFFSLMAASSVTFCFYGQVGYVSVDAWNIFTVICRMPNRICFKVYIHCRAVIVQGQRSSCS